MILEHVTQDSGSIVIAAAVLDIDQFKHTDLHALDVCSIPDRLKHRVGETEEEDILRCLLSKVMVNAVDLMFAKYCVQSAIQLDCACQVMPKGLLNDDPLPAMVLARQACDPEVVDDR